MINITAVIAAIMILIDISQSMVTFRYPYKVVEIWAILAEYRVASFNMQLQIIPMDWIVVYSVETKGSYKRYLVWNE